jgi:hypothetical protein
VLKDQANESASILRPTGSPVNCRLRANRSQSALKSVAHFPPPRSAGAIARLPSTSGFTIERDQMNALYFLNGDVQRQVIDQERKDNVIQNYQRDSGLPFVDVEVKNVVLDDLRQSPYSARIEFEKVFTNPADHTEVRRERWTATVTYVFRENVKNNELAVNPLGLTIVRFRADQAFS